MAEARAEEEEEALRRRDGGREQVVRRPQSSSRGRPDRRKPEHRHSQGPLSSIRAVIKRTTRPVSVAETPRDQERDQDRDRDRDRRRPQITILSAEPLPSTSWFPGAAAGIPPPPPPPAQVWGPAIHPSVQPPPSYEEVIREKTQEQVLLPSSSSTSSTCPVSRTTIATQTDPGSAPDPQGPPAVRPVRPPRPPLPNPLKSSAVDDITRTDSQSAVPSSDAEGAASNPRPPSLTHTSTCCDLLTDLCSPPTSTCGSQTDQSDSSLSAAAERPRPRPRTKLGRRPIGDEVKVQTLVKLREDGLATLAARASTNEEERQGKYLQELLEAFSSDDWGLPDQRSDSGEGSQSESEEEEEQREEDMAALRARIQAFERRGSCRDADDQETGPAERCAAKRPEPRPRPRLQGQPAKSAPPAVAPKPPNLSSDPKPSRKEFWEGDDVSAEPAEGPSAEPSPSSEPRPVTETPIPAPRPAPPKTSPSPTNPRPPPRPVVAPRARPGAPQRDRSSVEAGGGAQTVKGGSIRSNVPTKPAAPTSTRRASAPNLAPKPTVVPPARPDPDPVPTRPQSAASTATPKPSVPAKPPTPATRKGPVTQTTAEPASPPQPKSSSSPPPARPTSAKLLPPSSSRPPPIKSAPERPPPPVIDSAPAANQSPDSKAAPSTPSAGRLPSSQTAASSPAATTNQMQRVSKKGPPLPPRPQLGHPLYNNCTTQDVQIVLRDPAPAPSEGTDQTTAPPLITPSQSPLDQDPQPEPVQDQDNQSKPALDGQSNQQSILSEQPAEQKEQPEPPPVSGPRCIALFDYDGEKDDELTFSQGDPIALLELVDEAWGRGQIHGRVGLFPLNFTEVVEPLPAPMTSSEATDAAAVESSAALKPSEEWDVALFDFPGQTAEDLSFHRGALIQVMEHVDAEWRRGRLEGREGLYPAAFTQPRHTQPITDGLSAAKDSGLSAAKDSARALFDFAAEGQDELTLKVGDVITQVEPVDEQWILGVVGGRRGLVPKNYISFL